MLQLPEITGPVNNAHWALEGVRPEDLPAVWRRAWELLEKAVKRFPGSEEVWTVERTMIDVLGGKCQLWIAWSYDRRRIEGAVITCLTQSDKAPGKQLCELPLWGGENMPEWGADMFAMIRGWARERGADYLIGYGRRGWKRLFGASEWGVTEHGTPIFVKPVRE